MVEYSLHLQPKDPLVCCVWTLNETLSIDGMNNIFAKYCIRFMIARLVEHPRVSNIHFKEGANS